MNALNQFYEEKQALFTEKQRLIQEKKQVELSMVKSKNIVRSSGRLPNNQYRALCDTQNQHATELTRVEGQLGVIKRRLTEIAEIEFRDRQERGITGIQLRQSDSHSDRPLVSELTDLRKHYQDFAADATRVSSMRQMAAEFVVKLNPIIYRAVNGIKNYEDRA